MPVSLHTGSPSISPFRRVYSIQPLADADPSTASTRLQSTKPTKRSLLTSHGNRCASSSMHSSTSSVSPLGRLCRIRSSPILINSLCPPAVDIERKMTCRPLTGCRGQENAQIIARWSVMISPFRRVYRVHTLVADAEEQFALALQTEWR
ncbi:hypothetical protein BKA93DRAFT_805142 [Sparassis latifolia]